MYVPPNTPGYTGCARVCGALCGICRVRHFRNTRARQVCRVRDFLNTRVCRVRYLQNSRVCREYWICNTRQYPGPTGYVRFAPSKYPGMSGMQPSKYYIPVPGIYPTLTTLVAFMNGRHLLAHLFGSESETRWPQATPSLSRCATMCSCSLFMQSASCDTGQKRAANRPSDRTF